MMKYTDLKRIKEAPASGWILVYFRREVMFQRFNSIDEVGNMIGDNKILELHLFDKNKEYRALSSESPRFKNGAIEHVAKFKKDDNVYMQRTLPVKGAAAITVLNHLQFNEGGMSFIDDYRLIAEEVK